MTAMIFMLVYLFDIQYIDINTIYIKIKLE
jgi:hypothetical protein